MTILGHTANWILMTWPIVGKAPAHVQEYLVQLICNLTTEQELYAEIRYRDPLAGA